MNNTITITEACSIGSKYYDGFTRQEILDNINNIDENLKIEFGTRTQKFHLIDCYDRDYYTPFSQTIEEFIEGKPAGSSMILTGSLVK